MQDDEFRATMRQSVEMSNEARTFSEENWRKFAGKLSYFSGDLDTDTTYTQLAKRLEEMRSAGASGNHLFYLSVPASIAPKVIAGLGKAGLNHNEHGWARIVVEKPFGRDLESARTLNKTVLSGLRRELGVSHRPLSRQRDGAEHPDVPLRKFALRAAVEPQLHRLR